MHVLHLTVMRTVLYTDIADIDKAVNDHFTPTIMVTTALAAADSVLLLSVSAPAVDDR